MLRVRMQMNLARLSYFVGATVDTLVLISYAYLNNDEISPTSIITNNLFVFMVYLVTLYSAYVLLNISQGIEDVQFNKLNNIDELIATLTINGVLKYILVMASLIGLGAFGVVLITKLLSGG